MKSFVFHETFQPTGCSVNASRRGARMAATIGAGIQDRELFEALAGHNAFGTGGTNKVSTSLPIHVMSITDPRSRTLALLGGRQAEGTGS